MRHVNRETLIKVVVLVLFLLGFWLPVVEADPKPFV